MKRINEDNYGVGVGDFTPDGKYSAHLPTSGAVSLVIP
jgi:hypothetical protein